MDWCCDEQEVESQLQQEYESSREQVSSLEDQLMTEKRCRDDAEIEVGKQKQVTSTPCYHTIVIIVYGGILGLLWLFHLLFTVTDFSSGALPISVKFCVAVRPHLGQVLFHFGADSPRDGRVLGVSRGHMAGYASWCNTCYCCC